MTPLPIVAFPSIDSQNGDQCKFWTSSRWDENCARKCFGDDWLLLQVQAGGTQPWPCLQAGPLPQTPIVFPVGGSFSENRSSQWWHEGWGDKGSLSIPKWMNFRKISKRPLIPPPPLFQKNSLRFFPQTGCTRTKFAMKFFRWEMTPPAPPFWKKILRFLQTGQG